MLAAGVVLRDPSGCRRPLALMRELAEGSDRYGVDVCADAEGRWQFRVEAWGDPVAHWQHDAGIKIPIGQDAELMLTEGALLFERAAGQVRAPRRARKPAGPATAAWAQAARAQGETRAARAALTTLAATLRDRDIPAADRLAAAAASEIAAVLRAFPLRDLLTRSAAFPLVVQRRRALYGSWYEFFPRSEGAKIDPAGDSEPESGTLRAAQRRLEPIAEMGFDVVYLPPVHPIGSTARKGPNNTLGAAAGDPGSPWAIGSAAGGHDTIHPDLGTLADFDAFVSRARQLGMEVAMDFALQASPDHPWVAAHPEWFTTRADGSVAYAENPPKRYQDIFPLNFDNDPEGIYAEMLRVLRHWMDRGIRIFRVDNPHTKPLRFWDRLLAEVASTDPDVLFLAEAFTRPAMMHALALIGFHQSYTYFTWRNHADALAAYLTELAGPAAAYMRPNLFVNTPDILSDYLQHAGPAAFRVRATLAAMLSPSWGVYSGFELCENLPAAPGSEEYLDSEKYQYRPRDWDHAERTGAGISSFITRLNAIRRSHPALQQLRNLRFHYPDHPEILCFSKRIGPVPGGAPGGDTVLIVVNLNPHEARTATVWLDGPALGVDTSAGFGVTDELTGESFRWGQANYIRLDPWTAPAHIFTVTS